MSDKAVERWDVFELPLTGPAEGNPFLDVALTATFSHQHRSVEVEGFYDGGTTYKVRFMPDAVGTWRYATHSNAPALDGKDGTFNCTPAHGNNHGPVRVHRTYHFVYEDGTPHFSFGTTCYAWPHQGRTREEQTLETLRSAPFNKMRMCVFPKDYVFSRNEPEYHAFERREDGSFDFERFDPAFFRHFEGRVGDLRDLGIEADLILFHPYDRWGYSAMPPEVDDRYLRYLTARLAAYRNVWWSMANEYDLMTAKTMQDWDRFFRVVQSCDPYQHPRSIHNCRAFYDHGKPWVTHCSIQRANLEDVSLWREQYGKPVVVDECQYEGNIQHNWGNITAQELTHRFWEGSARGGYVGHGETYLHPEDILWWSKGGILHGQSPARIAFLRAIMEEGPAIDPFRANWDLTQGGDDTYRLIYLGRHRPAIKPVTLPENRHYTVEVIDTWDMTITPLEGTFSGSCQIPLPGKPYLALRIRCTGSD
ncbi:MAG: DUF5060 domain-containing protein [Anaerolineae bacterium]|nr:DUF5060 domain-containing protein [Anaerolineae bacterium]